MLTAPYSVPTLTENVTSSHWRYNQTAGLCVASFRKGEYRLYRLIQVYGSSSHLPNEAEWSCSGTVF